MKSIDIFYQGEGFREIEHLEGGLDQTFGDIKALLIERHGLHAEVLIFLEDGDEPIDELIVVREHTGPHGVKAHLHRCREIEVSVSFNGETVEHRFAPGTTVARVKRWAAEHKFGMSPEDAGEHVLQIAGSHDRPAPGSHVGTLAACPGCRLAFDLIADERVNGASGDEV